MGKTVCYYWERVSLSIVNSVEKWFYKLGVVVANHPWRTIALCWVIVALSSLGLLKFYHEKHPLKLWVPPESDFAKDTEWLVDTFKIGHRVQYILATAPNVLQPHILAELARINEKVNNIAANFHGDKVTWTDICFKVPILDVRLPVKRRRRSHSNASIFSDTMFSSFDDDLTAEPENEPFSDPSIFLNPSIYCAILDSFRMGCLQKSLLDLWKFDADTIANLTHEDIIQTLNFTRISPVLGHEMEYTASLGGIKMDSTGVIVSAESILLMWFVHVNFTTVDMEKTGNLAGTEVWASEEALAWEKEFLNVLDDASHNVKDLNIFYEAGRSFGDISGTTLFQDVDKLIIGIIMMFVYIQIILSKFNWVEVRFTLGSVGLLCIGMALLAACGVCSLIGIPYGPVHTSLPFLIMGLGIDDVFVMKACWEQLTDAERKLPLPNQIGSMLQHAGVSIVITSFTDIVAFLVGSITILPSLQSFCLYAAVGVLFEFAFSVTFYVAIFVLDVRRMRSKRNGVLFCIKHSDYTPSKKGQKSVSQYIFHHFYSKVVFKTPFQIFIILFTLGISAFSLESLLRLEQRFDPEWFIPENTYFKKYLDARKIYYPEMGQEGSVFIGAINYTEELPKIYSLVDKLESQEDAVHKIDTWTGAFRKYVLMHFKKDVSEATLSDSEWRSYLSKFLFSPTGAKYQWKFRFSEELICGKPTPTVITSSIDFTLKTFPGPDVYLPAMHRIKDIVEGSNFTTGDRFAIAWAKVFANWVTDEIIDKEVERNLELALLCVMACTVILITDIQMCFWILMCVLLTLVNVCGMMQRWGLTIDIVSCVGLELAIGLCVDYAAHVGHSFLTARGARRERAFATVTSIGAAVLYGGGSTFLALSVLSASESYIFKAFFKIFLLVISFGLFHGIIFLPVVLSLIGPGAYHGENENESAEPKHAEGEKDNETSKELIELSGRIVE